MTRCHTGTLMQLQDEGIDGDTAWQMIRGRTDEQIAGILANLRTLRSGPTTPSRDSDVSRARFASRRGRDLDD